MKEFPTPPTDFLPRGILKYLRDVREWILADRIVSSATLLVSEEAGGRIGHVQFPGGKGGIGGASKSDPFELLVESDGEAPKVFRLKGSTVFDEVPTFSSATVDGFDWLVTVTASGRIWASIAHDNAGVIASRTLAIGSTVPTNTSTTKHVQIGRYTVTGDTLEVHNDRYGPVGKSLCPDFWSNPKTWGVTW